jgi:fumarylacetoacetase
VPTFGPSRNLDYELESSLGRTGKRLGTLINIAEAADHIAGFCLLNDWSARRRAGVPAARPVPGQEPTSLPWVITPEALARPRGAGEPPAVIPRPCPTSSMKRTRRQVRSTSR